MVNNGNDKKHIKNKLEQEAMGFTNFLLLKISTHYKISIHYPLEDFYLACLFRTLIWTSDKQDYKFSFYLLTLGNHVIYLKLSFFICKLGAQEVPNLGDCLRIS